MATKNTAAAPTGARSKRRTVASLAQEIAELRQEVQALLSTVSAIRDQRASTPLPAQSVATLAVNVTPERTTAAPASGDPSTPAAATRATPKPAPVSAEASVQTQLRAQITEVFRLALVPLPDDEDAREALFHEFLEMIHSSRRGTRMLDQNNLSYVWDPIRQRPGIYLKEADTPGSFEIARTQPQELAAGTERVKLFLKARGRMPTPITLRRDNQRDGAWRIEASSL